MTHWANQYIGEPWVAADNDCWAFARRVWREQFALDVPPVDVDANNLLACCRAFGSHSEHANWLPVLDRPQEGDAALLGKSQARPSHVGIYVDADGGGVLHCVQGAGVVFTAAPTALNAGGWRVLGRYRHRSRCKNTVAVAMCEGGA